MSTSRERIYALFQNKLLVDEEVYWLGEPLHNYWHFKRRYLFYFVLGLLFTAIEQGPAGFQNKITKPEIFIPLILGAIVFFLCSTWLTSWYLRKLYGNHLGKLETLLRDLEVEPAK